MIGNLKTLALAGVLAASAAMTTAAQADGWIVGLVDGKSIVTIDPATRKVASTVSIRGAGPILGIDVRPADGTLYGVTSDGHLVTIDVKSGQATMRGKLSQPWKQAAATTFDFNPAADRLRLMSSDGMSLRINVDDGMVTVDGSHKFKDTDVNAGKTPRIVAGAYTNSYKGTKSTTLYNIDAATGSLVTQNAAERRHPQHRRPARHLRQRSGRVQHRGHWPGPERRVACHQRHALFGRSEDRQGDHGRQGQRPQRHAERHRLGRVNVSLVPNCARPAAMLRGGRCALTFIQFLK